jgi:transposase-like protein
MAYKGPVGPETQELIRRLLGRGWSVSKVATELGVTRNTVRAHRAIPTAAGEPVATAKFDPPAKPDPVKEAEERRARTRELDREREALTAVAGERSFRAFLADFFGRSLTPFDPPEVPKVAAGRGHERFPLLHLSDWHFEEIVKPAAVMGLNEYDMRIASRRVYRVVQAFRAWTRSQRAGGYALPELTVALNGDFLTGVLHGLERHSSAPNVVRATLSCGRLIALAIRDLAASYPRVRVYGTVGNHGRLPDDKKVPTKDPTRSFDYLAYSIARELTRECRNVAWDLPESYGAVYDVGGHSVYQGHGNFVKQQLGIVGYGMRRFVSNLAANMSAAGTSLRYAVFGHFHQASSAEFAGVTTFIGPSLIGTQEYGFLSSGSVNRPAQQCYVFDRELGHVATETVYGEGPGYVGVYPLDREETPADAQPRATRSDEAE